MRPRALRHATRTPRRSAWFVATLVVASILALAAPASAATTYVQPLWVTWDRSTLDVLIVPPEHGQVYNGNGPLGGLDPNELNPYQNSYLRAVERSVADWDRAVAEFGAPWLQTGLVTNVYVVGRDTVPQEALREPEIVIASDQNKTVILGFALRSGDVCLVNNSKFFVTSFTYEDMYNVNGQEYGHCLGLDHAFGTPNDMVIRHDVMYGTYNDSVGAAGVHLHCVSNLNVRGLELAYGPLFGQPEGDEVTLDSASYERISCQAPPP